MKLNEQITEDLMGKIAVDVTATIKRTLSIAPHPKLPVAMSAGAAAVAVVAAFLAEMTESYDPNEPDPRDVLLGALLVARLGIEGTDDPIAQAYDDYRALKDAGREPPAPAALAEEQA